VTNIAVIQMKRKKQEDFKGNYQVFGFIGKPLEDKDKKMPKHEAVQQALAELERRVPLKIPYGVDELLDENACKGRLERAREKSREHYRKKLEETGKSDFHYDTFVDALLLFEQGEDVERMVGKANIYLRALYKTSVSPRSIRGLKRDENDMGTAIRLGRLLERYEIFEKDDDFTGIVYKATEKGKDFLYALYPGLRKALEQDDLDDLTELQTDQYLQVMM
jgi:hypothetical protein